MLTRVCYGKMQTTLWNQLANYDLSTIVLKNPSTVMRMIPDLESKTIRDKKLIE